MRIAEARGRFAVSLAMLIVLALGVGWGAAALAGGDPGGLMGLALSLVAMYPVADGYRFFLKAFGVAPASLLTGPAARFNLTRFRDQLGFRHKFGTAFREVCQVFGTRRLVIVIDDLDRCGPQQVVTTLEAVNFLTSSGECIVLLGMDENRVKRAVALCGSENTAADGLNTAANDESRALYAERYLEKLVSLRVAVPPVNSEELQAVREE